MIHDLCIKNQKNQENGIGVTSKVQGGTVPVCTQNVGTVDVKRCLIKCCTCIRYSHFCVHRTRTNFFELSPECSIDQADVHHFHVS